MDASSILNDTKQLLGLLPEDTTFDVDVIMHINSTFFTLTQLGVGPVAGLTVTGPNEKWQEFFTDSRLNAVKSYVYVCVRLLFNPPQIAALISAMERQKSEMEYRLMVVAETG